jgi:delta8-fatty-acid desaturase
MGGISVGLWKDEHQTHHLVTNHVEHDPDIQLIPFVTVSTRFFNSVHSSFHGRTLTFNAFAKIMTRLQHVIGFLYIPMFKFLLYIAAPFFAIFSPRSRNTKKELVGMFLYYCWFGYLLSFLPTMDLRIMYFIVNNIFTSIVFLQIVLAHLAMPTDPYTEEEEFFKH